LFLLLLLLLLNRAVIIDENESIFIYGIVIALGTFVART
jgi:hypothetical protein